MLQRIRSGWDRNELWFQKLEKSGDSLESTFSQQKQKE